MKTKEQKDLTLIQIIDQFPTDETAREHLEGIRWKGGIVCPHCKCSDQSKFSTIAANPAKKVRAGLRWCSSCEKQFTVTVGTIFEDSHIPLRKWLIAWYLICSSKKGISSLQLQRNLELGSYRTALFMTHRIRFALKDPSFSEKLSGTIEVDETYIGGKQSGVGRGSKQNKVPVVSLLQRGGKVRSQVMRHVTGKNLKQVIKDNVTICADVNTDDNFAYRGLEPKFNHYVVKHSAKEYVRREKNRLVTTNGVEGFFSLLKRGVVGTFHHISEQHLPLYLAEFDHRHNCREMTDGERTINGIQKVEGKRLTYRQAA
ncbi:MAG TPA: IS1595 family transposase [Candidatus Aquilonibacter sp.]|nr:IS1595 family transposase [Candidatus Aquilonibacter sp.]